MSNLEVLLAAEARRAKRRKAIGKFISGVIADALLSLLGGWNLMLAVGVAHAEWIHGLPTVGYWWAALLVLLLQRVLPYSAGRSSK